MVENGNLQRTLGTVHRWCCLHLWQRSWAKVKPSWCFEACCRPAILIIIYLARASTLCWRQSSSSSSCHSWKESLKSCCQIIRKKTLHCVLGHLPAKMMINRLGKVFLGGHHPLFQQFNICRCVITGMANRPKSRNQVRTKAAWKLFFKLIIVSLWPQKAENTGILAHTLVMTGRRFHITIFMNELLLP